MPQLSGSVCWVPLSCVSGGGCCASQRLTAPAAAKLLLLYFATTCTGLNRIRRTHPFCLLRVLLLPLTLNPCPTHCIHAHLLLQLGGHLPASLGQLKRLAHLSLNDNSFTGSIPAEWGGMKGLQKLYMYNNPGVKTLSLLWLCFHCCLFDSAVRS